MTRSEIWIEAARRTVRDVALLVGGYVLWFSAWGAVWVLGS